VLQLAVKEGLEESPSIDNAIGHFRDLVKKIADSPKPLEALESICSILKIPNKKRDLDCPTRWNSTWKMIKTGLDLKDGIERLLRRIRLRHEGYCDFSIKPGEKLSEEIGSETWDLLTDFCTLLKIFEEVTVVMGGKGYPTLGL